MKMRFGFVSNSSSTSFTFCYEGEGIKPLTDLITGKYRNLFSRRYDEWSCDAYDIARELDRCFENKEIFPISVNKAIKNEKDNLAYVLEELMTEKDSYFRQRCIEQKFDLEHKIMKLKSAKDKGLDTVIVVGFGDNHGNVQGSNVGYAMDYDGRNIDIDTKDLVVCTEQNR